MAETLRRAGPRHEDETAAQFAARSPRYDDLGQRVTTCCGSYSTYMETGTFNSPEGQQALCCKACYGEVPIGEGDGTEFKPGVDPDAYYEEHFRRQRWEDAISHATRKETF